eukprot:639853-Pyramimonas_sp.AAC.1
MFLATWDNGIAKVVPQHGRVARVLLYMASTLVPTVIAPAKRRLLARTKCFLDDVDLQTISQAKSTLFRKARIAFTRWQIWGAHSSRWRGFNSVNLR